MHKEVLPNGIPDRIINKLIKNTDRSPSVGHIQVQEFIIVRDPALKKKLRKASINQRHIKMPLS